jgi:hypothetical protein
VNRDHLIKYIEKQLSVIEASERAADNDCGRAYGQTHVCLARSSLDTHFNEVTHEKHAVEEGRLRHRKGDFISRMLKK